MALESASYIDDLVSSNPTSSDPVSSGDDHLRLIKAVLLASLGGVDGPVEAGAGNGLATAAELSGLFDRLDALEGVGTNVGFVGEVKAFYGDTTDIPAGWYLCDGSNGTPDMRGRMLIGGNESPADGLPLYEGATQGGAIPSQQTTGPAGAHSHTVTIDDHTLTVDNLPEHRHYMTVGQTTSGNGNRIDAGDPDSISYRGGGMSNENYALHTSGSDTPDTGRTGLAGSATPDALSHSNAVAASNGNHTHTLDGSSLPPWHAVHWIMYTGA